MQCHFVTAKPRNGVGRLERVGYRSGIYHIARSMRVRNVCIAIHRHLDLAACLAIDMHCYIRYNFINLLSCV
jgi:hypothetical protein